MLMEALRTAREFSALPRLATVEAFSGLGDAEKVAVWEEVIDSLMASIELDERVDFRRAREISGQLLDTNTRSVQIPTSALVKEVGDAVLTSLDDYTGFIWPDEVRRFQQNTEGNFVGIGVQIRKAEDGGILVVAPLEESPAWKLGIQNKDVIVSVDGALVADWSLNDAVDRITGAEGTTVRLEVQRPEVEELLVFEVPRQRIEIPSVKGFQILERDEDGKPTWDWRLDSESKIGYFRLNQFARNSHLDLIKAWNTLCTQFDSEPNGVVLDLRGNPGGLLESAAAITNLFLREGTVVTQESPGGRIERRVWARPDGNVFGEVPVVVLVDEGSASASEIVSGALQAHRRAVVVGERTFGKGSVQTVQPAGRETFAKITEQYYRLPSVGDQPGRMVHKKLNAKVWGVDPQVEVWLPEGAEERRRGTWRKSDLRYAPTLNAPELLNEESELDPERVDSPDEAEEVKEPASPQSPYAMKEIEPGFDPNRTLQEGLDPALSLRDCCFVRAARPDLKTSCRHLPRGEIRCPSYNSIPSMSRATSVMSLSPRPERLMTNSAPFPSSAARHNAALTACAASRAHKCLQCGPTIAWLQERLRRRRWSTPPVRRRAKRHARANARVIQARGAGMDIGGLSPFVLKHK